MKIKMNKRPILSAAEKAMGDLVHLYGREVTKQITSNKWQWPTQPSPRDIVDLGQLRANQRATKVSALVWLMTWSTNYALYVFLGYITRSGTAIPARNAPKAALEAQDWGQAYAKLYQRYSP